MVQETPRWLHNLLDESYQQTAAMLPPGKGDITELREQLGLLVIPYRLMEQDGLSPNLMVVPRGVTKRNTEFWQRAFARIGQGYEDTVPRIDLIDPLANQPEQGWYVSLVGRRPVRALGHFAQAMAQHTPLDRPPKDYAASFTELATALAAGRVTTSLQRWYTRDRAQSRPRIGNPRPRTFDIASVPPSQAYWRWGSVQYGEQTCVPYEELVPAQPQRLVMQPQSSAASPEPAAALAVFSVLHAASI